MAIKIVQHLNWNLQSYNDREQMVLGLLEDGALDDLSPYQLNEVSNYLLYAQDIEVEVKLRNPTKPSVSYEELVDAGIADSMINKKSISIYKTVKPTIDKEKDKDIPGMAELWEAIELIKEKYDYVKDVIKGVREPDFDNPIKPTFVAHNFYRSWYIDLCRNQYYLKDIFKPTICAGPTFNHYYGTPDIFGIKAGKYILCAHEHAIDFGNPEHIYQLLRQYANIKEKHYDKMNDDWNYLYIALDEIIANVNWSDTHWDILQMKINGFSNEDISDYIQKTYDVHYSVNYVSTIFRRHISRDIAKKAINLAYQWSVKDDKEKWKTCSRCKTERLDAQEFFGKNKRVCLFCTGKKKGVDRKIHLIGLPDDYS